MLRRLYYNILRGWVSVLYYGGILEIMYYVYDCIINTAYRMKEIGYLGSTFFIGNRLILYL